MNLIARFSCRAVFHIYILQYCFGNCAAIVNISSNNIVCSIYNGANLMYNRIGNSIIIISSIHRSIQWDAVVLRKTHHRIGHSATLSLHGNAYVSSEAQHHHHHRASPSSLRHYFCHMKTESVRIERIHAIAFASIYMLV